MSAAFEATLLAHEGTIRLAAFVTALVGMSLWETLSPRRMRMLPRLRRWITNLSMVALGTLALRAAFPLLAVGVALWAAQSGWGLFHWLSVPFWLALILGVVILDLAIYAQHVAFHKIPLFWAVHKVHHADRDVDATTALRFHPFEYALSMLYKIAVVALLGVPAAAVILFEVILNASALFNHANLRLPGPVDRVLRMMLVTPDMHRIHHSARRNETDSNYGFCLSLWDRMFRTYTREPQGGQDGFTIGLAPYQDARPGGAWFSLVLPFVRDRQTTDETAER